MLLLFSVTWTVAALFAQLATAADNYTNSAKMRVQVTQHGLHYASEIAAAIVNNELLSLNVPPLQHDFDGGTVSADSIRVTSLLSPVYDYRLAEPNMVIWTINGGRLTVEGHYRGSVKVLFAPISGSGPFKATVNGLQLTVQVSVNVEQSRPIVQSNPDIRVSVIDCQAQLNQVDLQIGGGIVGWLMNRLDEQITSQLPPKLQVVVCEHVTNFITRDVNDKLQTIPVTANLDNSTQLDYGLITAPIVLKNSLELLHKGEIRFLGAKEILPSLSISETTFNFNESEPELKSNSSKMLRIAISDQMLNSYLYQSFHSGSRSLTVDKTTNPERAKFLEAQCSEKEICIGKYLDDYRQAFSNASMSAELGLSEPANVAFVDGIAQCFANGSISLLADGRVVLAVNVSVEAVLTTNVQSEANGTLLKGALSFASLVVSSAGQSEIGSLNDPFAMDSMVSLTKLVFEAEMNDILNSGAPIPVPHGVKLINVDSLFADKDLLLFCDIEYLPAK